MDIFEAMRQQREFEMVVGSYYFVPEWAWRVDQALRVHGPMTNKQLAEIVRRPPQRTHEVVTRMQRLGMLTKHREGKNVILKLPEHHCA